MEIKVVENSKSINCDLLVVSMFEGEKTSCELANKYAVDEDKFEGNVENRFYPFFIIW